MLHFCFKFSPPQEKEESPHLLLGSYHVKRFVIPWSLRGSARINRIMCLPSFGLTFGNIGSSQAYHIGLMISIYRIRRLSQGGRDWSESPSFSVQSAEAHGEVGGCSSVDITSLDSVSVFTCNFSAAVPIRDLILCFLRDFLLGTLLSGVGGRGADVSICFSVGMTLNVWGCTRGDWQ